MSPNPISSNISGSPNNQSSLRVFRNLSSKQPQTQQILKNNNNNQRSSSRTASSPSSPDTSSPLREQDNIISNSPLDFTSKKVNLFSDVFHVLYLRLAYLTFNPQLTFIGLNRPYHRPLRHIQIRKMKLEWMIAEMNVMVNTLVETALLTVRKKIKITMLYK